MSETNRILLIEERVLMWSNPYILQYYVKKIDCNFCIQKTCQKPTVFVYVPVMDYVGDVGRLRHMGWEVGRVHSEPAVFSQMGFHGLDASAYSCCYQYFRRSHAFPSENGGKAGASRL